MSVGRWCAGVVGVGVLLQVGVSGAAWAQQAPEAPAETQGEGAPPPAEGDTPADPAPGPTQGSNPLGQEIPTINIYVDDLAVQRAYMEISAALEEAGWRRGRRTDEGIEFRPTNVWGAVVVLDNDGYLRIHRSHTTFKGALLSRRRFLKQQELAVEATKEALIAYQDALADQSLRKKLAVLPDRMDAIWLEGIDPQTGQHYASPADRRQALMGIWLDTADNQWGAAVRASVSDYMMIIVQSSSHPYTAEELQAANSQVSWPDRLTF